MACTKTSLSKAILRVSGLRPLANPGRTQKFIIVGGCENAFLQISWDSSGEDFFLEINILRDILGHLFVAVASGVAENDILHLPKGGARGSHFRSPLHKLCRTAPLFTYSYTLPLYTKTT